MERRRYLRTLGALAGGSLLAGCSNAPGDGRGGPTDAGGTQRLTSARPAPTTDGGTTRSDATSEGEASEERTTTEEETPEPTATAADVIDRAVDDLNTGGLALLAAKERLDEEGSLEFDPTRVTEQTDAARAALSSAADRSLSDAEKRDVADLRGVADALDRVAAAVSTLGDVAASLEDVQSLIQDRKFAAAADAIDEPLANAKTADGKATAAHRAVQDLDGSNLSDLGVAYDQLASGLASLATATDAVVDLSAGTEAVAEGGVDLQEGQRRSDNRNYSGAADSFAAAKTTFASAESTYEGAPDGAPSAITSRIDFAICRTTHLKAAAGHFESAAEAASGGDLSTANREESAGQDEVDKAMNC